MHLYQILFAIVLLFVISDRSLAFPVTDDATTKRTWTDSTGRYSVEATLVGVKGGKVSLKKDDGTISEVPLKRLSDADQRLIRGLVSEESTPQVNTAKFALRLGNDQALLAQYKENPDGYPTCREKIDLLHFDGTPLEWKKSLFKSDLALIEKGSYDKKSPGYTGDEVVERIATYEKHGWKVWGVFVYREEWLHQEQGLGEAGPFAVDRRILSPTDLENIRSAIAKSRLKCRKTVRIIQLLGGRVQGQHGDSWTQMSEEIKRHLSNFDGVGTECHIGDHKTTKTSPDGPATLKAMAEMAKWALDNEKIAFVFMGGNPNTYENLDSCQRTYQQLWSELHSVGLEKNAAHLAYFRQGARLGKQIPESDSSTLTHQIKWVIDQAK